MTIQIDAIYQGGILRPKEPLSLPEGTEVRVAIQTPVNQHDDPLAGVIGIGEGPESGDAASCHDNHLYGKSKK